MTNEAFKHHGKAKPLCKTLWHVYFISPGTASIPMTEPSERLRFDKWLWAARFFKTRSLAAQAIEGGRARLNEARVKSSRDVTVLALSDKRGPASAAAFLYSEGEESRARRQLMLAMRRAAPQPDPNARGRPTKRDRRLLHKFTEG
jgi:ribosome-associated heat shock protein Hsp15